MELVGKMMILGTMQIGRATPMRHEPGSKLPYLNPWRPATREDDRRTQNGRQQRQRQVATGMSVATGPESASPLKLPAIGSAASDTVEDQTETEMSEKPGSAHSQRSQHSRQSQRSSHSQHSSHSQRLVAVNRSRIMQARRERLRQAASLSTQSEPASMEEKGGVSSLAPSTSTPMTRENREEAASQLDTASAQPAEGKEEEEQEQQQEEEEGEEEVDRSAIVRNRLGEEEPHSDSPELWNIDGTEVDIRAKYKVGGQMWYLQTRATDAIKKKRAIAGQPMNRLAIAEDRAFRLD
eukprot:COSAG01_NODE_49_length_31891_cov_29.945773_38_plen_295_part_00